MDFQQLNDLRKEYETEGIQESKLSIDPIKNLKSWFKLATETTPGRWFETNAMSLATSDPNGDVSVRIVLLKGITETGIQFFTNYDSAKGQQLAANPKAAVAFHWPWLGRQVRIQGTVEKTTRKISETYFHSRPRGSQIGALASKQSHRVESRDQLDRDARALIQKLDGQPVPCPENWGGYLLQPARIEFWQGRLDRLHDRIVFEKSDSTWSRFRLSP